MRQRLDLTGAASALTFLQKLFLAEAENMLAEARSERFGIQPRDSFVVGNPASDLLLGQQLSVATPSLTKRGCRLQTTLEAAAGPNLIVSHTVEAARNDGGPLPLEFVKLCV